MDFKRIKQTIWERENLNFLNQEEDVEPYGHSRPHHRLVKSTSHTVVFEVYMDLDLDSCES